jgi:hypothetical protein
LCLFYVLSYRRQHFIVLIRVNGSKRKICLQRMFRDLENNGNMSYSQKVILKAYYDNSF